MDSRFDDIKRIRKVILEMADGFSAAQLNEIPEGFNNNIIWNLAHLVAAQQGLCYFRSGLEMPVGQEFYDLYKAGTKPVQEVSEEEINQIKELLFSAIDVTEADYKKDLFKSYDAYTTRYGIELDSIDKALQYVLFHEGTHFGYIASLKKLITKNI